MAVIGNASVVFVGSAVSVIVADADASVIADDDGVAVVDDVVADSDIAVAAAADDVTADASVIVDDDVAVVVVFAAAAEESVSWTPILSFFPPIFIMAKLRKIPLISSAEPHTASWFSRKLIFRAEGIPQKKTNGAMMSRDCFCPIPSSMRTFIGKENKDIRVLLFFIN